MRRSRWSPEGLRPGGPLPSRRWRPAPSAAIDRRRLRYVARMRRRLGSVAALAVAATAVVAAMPGSGPTDRPAATQTGLDSLVAELMAGSARADAGDPSLRRGDPQHLPIPAPAPPPEGCSTFAERSPDCSDLPKDGCSVPAVRVPRHRLRRASRGGLLRAARGARRPAAPMQGGGHRASCPSTGSDPTSALVDHARSALRRGQSRRRPSLRHLYRNNSGTFGVEGLQALARPQPCSRFCALIHERRTLPIRIRCGWSPTSMLAISFFFA